VVCLANLRKVSKPTINLDKMFSRKFEVPKMTRKQAFKKMFLVLFFFLFGLPFDVEIEQLNLLTKKQKKQVFRFKY